MTDEMRVAEVQKKLLDLYSTYFPNLCQTFEKIDTFQERISYPLLLDAAQEYCQSDIKLMIIGKETFGWCWDDNKPYFDVNEDNLISKLMNLYTGFLNSNNAIATPFWNMTMKLQRKLNPSANTRLSVSWNNIIKMDQDKKRIRNNYEELVSTVFPVIPDEVDILKPDIVVFFTSHNYDAALLREFKGAFFEKIDEIEEKMLVRVVHDNLPINSYRTYHPKYLKLKKHEDFVIEKIIENIGVNLGKSGNKKIVGRVFAQQGSNRFLIYNGYGKGQVLDREENKLYPPFNIHSIIARGYWEDPDKNYDFSELLDGVEELPPHE